MSLDFETVDESIRGLVSQCVLEGFQFDGPDQLMIDGAAIASRIVETMAIAETTDKTIQMMLIVLAHVAVKEGSRHGLTGGKMNNALMYRHRAEILALLESDANEA